MDVKLIQTGAELRQRCDPVAYALEAGSWSKQRGSHHRAPRSMARPSIARIYKASCSATTWPTA